VPVRASVDVSTGEVHFFVTQDGKSPRRSARGTAVRRRGLVAGPDHRVDPRLVVELTKAGGELDQDDGPELNAEGLTYDDIVRPYSLGEAFWADSPGFMCLDEASRGAESKSMLPIRGGGIADQPWRNSIQGLRNYPPSELARSATCASSARRRAGDSTSA
jgi:hypothetical protein